MDRQQIIDKAWETVDEIKASPLYQDYLASLRTLKEQADLRLLVEAFDRQKAIFETVKSKGQYHPDFSREAKKLADAKDALFIRAEYQKYLSAQKALNANLSQIGSAIQDLLDDCTLTSNKKCQGR
jgi:cell fate (sporulation/competence/biofilm development) regulator YlbF (YheA/YmcA/DUF963 family)